MAPGRKSLATPNAKRRLSRLPVTESTPQTPNTRKRAGETMAVRTKKIRSENEAFFSQLKKAHDDEMCSKVLSLGSGDAGQLGLGEEHIERKRPFPISGLVDIVKIRAGGMHNICLSKSGEVSTFGCNDDFALGRKIVEDEESMVPGKVTIPSDSPVIDVTAGDSHSAALTANGQVFIWGSFRDNNGIIGLLKPFERVPEPIEVHTDYKIVKIASGENHFVMLTDMGDILTFGCAEQGQLGRIREVYLVRGGKSGMTILLTPAPMRVKQHLRFSDVWAGSNCTVARSVDGNVYGCGLNNFTQLGIFNELTVLLMTKMDKFNILGHTWKSFAFGQHHTLALTNTNKVFVIGRGDYGNLGLGDNISREEVTEVCTGEVESVAACSHISYVLLRDGSVLSWGCGNTYQLGHGDDEDVNKPTKVVGKHVASMRIIEVSVGGQHVVFRALDRVPEACDEKVADVVTSEIVTTVESVSSSVEATALVETVEEVMEVVKEVEESPAVETLIPIVEESKVEVLEGMEVDPEH